MARVDHLLTLWHLVSLVRRQRTVPASVKVAMRDWALRATAALHGRRVPPAGRLSSEDARVIVWDFLDALDAAGVGHAEVAGFLNSHARRSARPEAQGDLLAVAIPDGFVLVNERRFDEFAKEDGR